MSDKDSKKERERERQRERERLIERGRGTDYHCKVAETGLRQRQNQRGRGIQTMKQENGKRSEISRQMYRKKNA